LAIKKQPITLNLIENTLFHHKKHNGNNGFANYLYVWIWHMTFQLLVFLPSITQMNGMSIFFKVSWNRTTLLVNSVFIQVLSFQWWSLVSKYVIIFHSMHPLPNFVVHVVIFCKTTYNSLNWFFKSQHKLSNQIVIILVGARDLRPLWSPPVSLNLVSSIPLIGTDNS
jgi:hypothetical protein